MSGDFYGLGENYFFLSDLQGYIKYSQAWCFQRHRCSEGQRTERVSANASGRKIHLEVEVETSLTLVGGVCGVGGENMEVEQNPFSLFP